MDIPKKKIKNRGNGYTKEIKIKKTELTKHSETK